MQRIGVEETLWERTFETLKIKPYRIFYEDFNGVSRREKVISEILDYLGVDYTLPLNIETDMVRQRDTYSDELAEALIDKIDRDGAYY